MTHGRGAERAVLVTVALGAILAPLNSTMIAVALPRIIDDFHTSVGTAGWLVTSYLLALAVVQPVAGKLGDRHGRRGFILGGLALFGLASLGAALAPSLPFLIGFRVVQAISGAVIFPNGAGLIRELIGPDRRGGAFGLVGGSLALAAGLGPLLGGLLVLAGGWSAIFYVNLPLVAAALLVAWRAVPRRPGALPETAFDWLGAMLLAVVLCGVAALVIESRHAHGALLPGHPAARRARGRVRAQGAAPPRIPCSSRASSRSAGSPPRTRRSRRATWASTRCCSRRRSCSRGICTGARSRSAAPWRCCPRRWPCSPRWAGGSRTAAGGACPR